MSDERELYESIVTAMDDTAMYPPVRVVEVDGLVWLECAQGHHWGTRTPGECPTCRKNHDFRAAGRPECTYDGCHNVVTCSDRAFEGGVRTCEMHWSREAANDLTSGPVSIDDTFEFFAQYPRLRWNGWVMPSFDAWSVQQIIETLAMDQPEYYRLTWRDDLSLEFTQLDGEDEYTDIIEPDEDGLYAVGAGSWTWQENPDFYRSAEWREWERQRVRVWVEASNAENHRQIADGITNRMGANEAAAERAVAEWTTTNPEPTA